MLAPRSSIWRWHAVGPGTDLDPLPPHRWHRGTIFSRCGELMLGTDADLALGRAGNHGLRGRVVEPPQIGEHGETLLAVDVAQGLGQDRVVELAVAEDVPLTFRIELAQMKHHGGHHIVDMPRRRQHRDAEVIQQHGLNGEQPVLVGHLQPSSGVELADAAVDAVRCRR